jgi:hypothetical protein
MNRHERRRAKLFEKRGNMIVMDRREAFLGTCAFCGVNADLRPYGPNNENICFDCAMKDEATTSRKFREMIDGLA